MSRMTRLTGMLLVAAPLALGACKKAETPPPPPPPPVAPAGLVVTNVRVGRDVNSHKLVDSNMVAIGLRDDFHVSVMTDGRGTEVPVIARWMDPAGAVLKVDTTHVSADGPEATDLKLSRTRTWAPGKYKVEVTVGTAAARTVEFDVRNR
jgi:hypothetical protein